MQERVCNGVWSSGASEVLGELQMEKVHVYYNAVRHGQCVLCASITVHNNNSTAD